MPETTQVSDYFTLKNEFHISISDHYKHAQFSKIADADHNKTPEPFSVTILTTEKNLNIFAQTVQNCFTFRQFYVIFVKRPTHFPSVFPIKCVLPNSCGINSCLIQGEKGEPGLGEKDGNFSTKVSSIVLQLKTNLSAKIDFSVLSLLVKCKN